ncbi:MAG: sugar transferase [Bacteroidota bacterium]|nr:sugar transferase [Bacteroidota bacterium]
MGGRRRIQELWVLLLADVIAVSLAWMAYYYIRVRSGLFILPTIPDFFLPMMVVNLYWLIVFWLFGLYRPWWAKSRVDELILVGKAVTFGVIILFFVIFLDDALTQETATSRLKIVLYWAILLVFVGSGRACVRSVRRRMLLAGIGHRNTLIVGSGKKAEELKCLVENFPALGYRVIGGIFTDSDAHDEKNHCLQKIGELSDLEDVIKRENIEEILIALASTEHELLLEIIGRCSAFNVGIKIRPDMYDIVSGQARTNQLYGIPLIEVTPQLLAPWEAFLKRAIDITVSLVILTLGAPLFLILAVAQKLTNPGPVFYRQQRVGKDMKTFRIIKFRTMYVDAEKQTGPRWAQKDDPRVTPLGRFLRKTHLDELPQMINVLQGDMSLVGPRPERPFFVEKFIKEIPLYRRRLNVRPGLTGWAQVKHRYDQSIEDVRTKLSYDLFYIENMSIRMDLKILLSTTYNVLRGRGHT